MSALRRVALALWLGIGATILGIAAPATFRYVQGPAAADIVGAMLNVWHWAAVLVPAVVLLFCRRRRLPSLLLAAALVMALAQLAIDLKIHAIRAASPVPISSLAKSDPVRKHFGMLHGVSSLLMLLQVVGAAVVVATDRD
jgi:glycerol-3-phosphate acyltransferase PlsY